MSWNIDGLNDYKLGCSELVDIISKHDICFLFESWANSKSKLDINGYVTHTLHRKCQHRNARRCSGGVILYYREHLKHGIEVVINNYDTIIWIKLKHDFFNLENYIYICGAYIWGNDISLDQFKTFFSNISNNTEDCNNNEAETFCEKHDFNCLNDKSPELDNPITIDEIQFAIKSLKSFWK